MQAEGRIPAGRVEASIATLPEAIPHNIRRLRMYLIIVSSSLLDGRPGIKQRHAILL
jgi:hypothetical protein